MRYFIGGVANVTLYKGNDILLKSTTLSDSSMELSVDKTEVRGGMGAKLYGQYFHTSQLKLTLTDILFNLDYVALNTGSAKNIGGVAYATETVTLGASGAGTITGTAIPFNSTYVAWVRPQSGDTFTTVTLDATQHKSFTYAGASGTVVCVEYPVSSSGEYITIPATIIPDTVHAVMEANLYAAGGSTNDISTATLAGKAIIDIPRLQMTGAQTISMSATGVSNTPLTGMALAVDSGTCADDAVYGTFTTNLTGSAWYDGMTMLSFADSTLTMVHSTGTAQITAYGIGTGYAPYAAPASDLTYTPTDATIATVSATGLVTGKTAGDTSIVVSVKKKPSVTGVVKIIVS